MTENEWLDNNELSVNIWRKKYCHNGETFEEWLDRVSAGDEEIKRLIREKKFLFGGRTLANRGTNRGSLSNCYSVGYVPDSLSGILDTAKQIGMTFKSQGGQGLSLSKIRPKGSLIHGQFESDGIIPFMEIFNTVTESVSQGGSRKGALLMSLDINHEEAETFMKVKSDLKRITKANLSMEIDDAFMNNVKDGLFSSDSNKAFSPEVNKFKLLAEQACKYAEPGVIFTNRFRNYNIMERVNAYNIETCNPCVVGETLILTKNGEIRIDNLINKQVEIWNGEEWSSVIPIVTGHNQPILRIELENGNYIDCTYYHKFVMGDSSKKEAKILKIGDKLAEYTTPDGNTIEQVIKSISENGIAETVYCFTEEKLHRGVFNGILTAQCGEQPLPKHGACNLSSINISEYICNPFKDDDVYVDWNELSKDLGCIVRAMDDVLDENLPNHALQEQREMAEKYRNIGIGIMGLHDALIKMNMVYGSDEAVQFTSYLMKFIFRQALLHSVNLAKERGNFPGYTSDVWDSEIIQNAFTEEEIDNFRYGNMLRNCSLLSVAPTGSIGTMLNISTGVEPFFATSYTRKTVSLNGEDTYFTVDVPVIAEAKKNWVQDNVLITSNDIDWHNRINMQSAMQQYVDTAISSTINLPKSTTPSDVEALYLYAWEKGLKGVTIYVDGSRDPILSTNPDDKKDCKCNGTLTHSAPKRPKVLPCDVKRFTNEGKKWIACVGLYENQPFELFTGFAEKLDIPSYVTHAEIIKNKVDGVVYNEDTEQEESKKVSRYDIRYVDDKGETHVLEGVNNVFRTEFYNVAKMVSGILRHGMPVEYVISTIKSLDFNQTSVNSWRSGVIRALKAYIKDGEVQGETCPECGGKLVRENGCIHCIECGWSKCG